jgi:transcriptional antiterminator RfaH
MSNQKWFVARVKARSEVIASTNLQSQGFSTFNPTLKRTTRHARQFREKRVPIFPGYLFLSFDPTTAAWRSVNGTRGVVALITAAGEPVAVPDSAMKILRSNFGCGDAMTTASLAVGDSVRFMAGPFADSIGKLASIDSRGRIEVLLAVLGTQINVKADVSICVPMQVAA